MKTRVHLGEREDNLVSVRAGGNDIRNQRDTVEFFTNGCAEFHQEFGKGDAGINVIGVRMRVVDRYCGVRKGFEVSRFDQSILVIRISGNEQIVFFRRRIHFDWRADGCDPEVDGNGLCFSSLLDLNVSGDASETRATDEEGVSTRLQIEREVALAIRFHSGGCAIGCRRHADASIADTHARRLRHLDDNRHGCGSLAGSKSGGKKEREAKQAGGDTSHGRSIGRNEA